MAAHRYWRVNITDVQGWATTQIGVVEFQFRETAGVSQTFSGGTASTNGGGTASNASDNNTSTTWTTTAGTTAAWWKYDYGSGVTKDIVELTIRCGTNLQDRAPRDFTLEWSDDNSAWTVAETMSGVNDWTSAQTKTFTLPLSPLPVKVSQVVLESALDGDSVSVSQVVPEVVLSSTQAAKVSQVVMESAQGKQYAKVSQSVMESALGKQYAKVSHSVLEIIYEFVEDTPAAGTRKWMWVVS